MKEVIPVMVHTFRKQVLMGVLGCALASGPVLSAEGIDADADDILKAMSSYLGGLNAFSVDADIDLEVVTTAGQKVQFSSFSAHRSTMTILSSHSRTWPGGIPRL